MSDITTIRVRTSGPYLIEGPFRLIDAEGNAYMVNPGKPTALCRCGQSSKRPFCDGTHRTCGFVSEENAPVE